MKQNLRAGDWFGCGRKITTESWAGFLKAQAEYWKQHDEKQSLKISNLENQRRQKVAGPRNENFPY